jgi:hypothetical protein
MTARLDQVAPGAERQRADSPPGRQRREPREDDPGDELDVPEFIPRA